MRARSSKFVISAAAESTFPKAFGPEIGFAGRSNVGKSSLINALTGFKGLARTSSTPGRTRLLNWFEIVPPMGPDKLAFVDLPGYGYAKVSRETRQSFGPLVEAFIKRREALALTIIIVDARRGIEDEEHELIGWLNETDQAWLVVLTKADKLSKNQRYPVAAAVRKEIKAKRDPILFSASEPFGVDELWRAILSAV
jgi:GTP-binding protein